MSNILYIPEDRVKELLCWEDTIKAIELAMVCVTENRVSQNPRSITKIPSTDNLLFSMPGYLENDSFKALGCKLVTSFPSNKEQNLPSILANILLLNEETGMLEAVIAATEITAWRTAAASVVATKYLHLRHPKRKNDILAILGAGTQGNIHAVAFQYTFNFKEVHIWNRNAQRAKDLVDKLNHSGQHNGLFISFDEVKDCVKNADVIVTTTFASTPILKFEWLKPGVHINGVSSESPATSVIEVASSLILIPASPPSCASVSPIVLPASPPSWGVNFPRYRSAASVSARNSNELRAAGSPYCRFTNTATDERFTRGPRQREAVSSMWTSYTTIGAGDNTLELEEDIYKKSYIYVDHLSGAKDELRKLEVMGVTFKGEIGSLINGSLTGPDLERITIFQSLGMAAEDCAMARMIYNKHMRKSK